MSNQPVYSSAAQSIIAEIQLEVKVNQDGEGFISRRGLSKLLGVSASRFQVSKEGALYLSAKLLEKLTRYGFDPALIFNDERGIPDSVCGLLANYFAYESNQPSEKAKLLVDVFAATSMRQLCQSAVGWQTKQQSSEYPANWTAEFKQMVDAAWQSVQHQKNISDQPGEQIIWRESSTKQLNSLDGYLTPSQWLEQQPYDLSHKGKIRFGQMAAEQHKKAYHYSPRKGHIQGRPGNFKFYPASFEPQFRAILELVVLEPGNLES